MSACVLACGTVFAASSASATISVTSYTLDSPGYRVGSVNFLDPTTGQPKSENAAVGRIRMTGTENGKPISISTYCIDVYDWLQTGTFTAASWSMAAIAADKKTAISTLLAHVDPISTLHTSLVTNADTSAAVQMAIWEILDETSGSYDLKTGTFSVTGGDVSNAQTIANSYLAMLPAWSADPNTSKLALRTLTGSVNGVANQSQLTNAVPEASTWAMMIIGFGAIGGTMRARLRGGKPAIA